MVKKMLAAIVGALILVTSPAMAGSKMSTDMLAPSFQMNNECSATVIKSKVSDTKNLMKAETVLLTAAHCVGNNKDGRLNYSVRDPETHLMIEERNVVYDVTKRDIKHDLALITLRDTVHFYPTAFVADDIEIELGDPTWAVGFPLAGVKTITQGLYGGYQEFPMHSLSPTEIYLRSTTQISPGNSGGGLFQYSVKNDRYELIGVTVRGIPEIAHVGLYVPLDEVRDFIDAPTPSSIYAPFFWEVPSGK